VNCKIRREKKEEKQAAREAHCRTDCSWAWRWIHHRSVALPVVFPRRYVLSRGSRRDPTKSKSKTSPSARRCASSHRCLWPSPRRPGLDASPPALPLLTPDPAGRRWVGTGTSTSLWKRWCARVEASGRRRRDPAAPCRPPTAGLLLPEISRVGGRKKKPPPLTAAVDATPPRRVARTRPPPGGSLIVRDS
jgi:hypothetical protein